MGTQHAVTLVTVFVVMLTVWRVVMLTENSAAKLMVNLATEEME